MSPRIDPVTEPTERQAELLAGARVAGEEPIGIFRTLVHHPEMFRRALGLGATFLFEGKLPGREREIVILRTAWRAGSEYEWGQHLVIGGEAGLTATEMTALATDEPAGSDDDQALVAMVDELFADHRLSEATWDALATRWDVPERIELLLLCGFYRMLAGFLNTADVALDPGIDGFP